MYRFSVLGKIVYEVFLNVFFVLLESNGEEYLFKNISYRLCKVIFILMENKIKFF